VVALWAGAAASLVELYRLAPSKVFVIPNARDADAFPVVTESSRDAARRQFGVAADSAVVGYIGALSSEKRPDLAVASVRQVSGAQLLVAGDGPLEPSIRAIAAHDRNVTMLGSLDDVVEMLHACDVILLTSRTEGMPGVLIEASMCGVRFVATAVGAVVELCEPPSSTVAVDSSADVIAHAVRTTMEPRAEPWDLARVARDRYDWQRVVPLWLDVLDRYG
jgi:glycosyltransferase involved in cell wall biosynthesis